MNLNPTTTNLRSVLVWLSTFKHRTTHTTNVSVLCRIAVLHQTERDRRSQRSAVVTLACGCALVDPVTPFAFKAHTTITNDTFRLPRTSQGHFSGHVFAMSSQTAQLLMSRQTKTIPAPCLTCVVARSYRKSRRCVVQLRNARRVRGGSTSPPRGSKEREFQMWRGSDSD